jgi:hypothetical protein
MQHNSYFRYGVISSITAGSFYIDYRIHLSTPGLLQEPEGKDKKNRRLPPDPLPPKIRTELVNPKSHQYGTNRPDPGERKRCKRKYDHGIRHRIPLLCRDPAFCLSIHHVLATARAGRSEWSQEQWFIYGPEVPKKNFRISKFILILP